MRILDWLPPDALPTSDAFWAAKTAAHWDVDGRPDSVQRLVHHLEVRTFMRRSFERGCALIPDRIRGTVVDLGAGVGWTSAFLSREPAVERTYAVDISRKRLKVVPYVFDGLGGVWAKLRLVRGSFEPLRLPNASVDLIVMNGSLHHCYADQLRRFVTEARRVLKPDGVVLIANEHYVRWPWTVRRFVGESVRGRVPRGLRQPLADTGEHWRTRQELEQSLPGIRITDVRFRTGDTRYTIFQRLGWHTYVGVWRP